MHYYAYIDLVCLVLSPACFLHEILRPSLPVRLPGASLVVPGAPVVMSPSSIHPVVVITAVIVPVPVPPTVTATSVSPAPLLRAAVHPTVSRRVSVPSGRVVPVWAGGPVVVTTNKVRREIEKQ